MRLFDVKLGFNPTTIVAGLGVVLLAPPLVSAAPRFLRSAAKTVIKAGYIISNKMRFVYWDKEPSIVVGGAGTEKSDAGQGDLVFVSSGGKKYHKGSCSFAQDARQALPLAEALAAGYEPCKVCSA